MVMFLLPKLLFLLLIIITVNAQRTTPAHSNALNKNHQTITKPEKNRRKWSINVTKWEFEDDESLEYPRGDKQKLHQISTIWSEHYNCISRVAATVTEWGFLPAVHVTTFSGAVARLPCGVCVAPDERERIQWVYGRFTDSKFDRLPPKRNAIGEPNGNLTIYGVGTDDSGVYMCTIGQSVGGPVILDVVEPRDNYDVVKPLSTRDSYPTPKETIRVDNMTLLVMTTWSPWSECSACSQVGRRRKYGMCYVRLGQRNKGKIEPEHGTSSHPRVDDMQILDHDTLKLFKAFPGGIPCQSQFLPPLLKQLAPIKQRRNEVMIGLCKVDCETKPTEILTSNIKRPTDSNPNVYFTKSPSARVLFAPRGDPLRIMCPGVATRDMPLSWRVGSKALSALAADRGSGSRVRLDARDQIVFSHLTYPDTNLYSCWQRDALIGTVKLVVWKGPQPRWDHHILLLVTLLFAVLLLRVVDRALRNKRHEFGVV